jgi:hypothetical protein
MMISADHERRFPPASMARHNADDPRIAILARGARKIAEDGVMALY